MYVDDLIRWQRPAAREDMFQVVPFQVLHDDVWTAIMHVRIDGSDHIGVVEEPDDLHLAEEPGDRRLAQRTVGQDHLEGDHAIHQAVPRLEDPAPRPLADVVEQGIAAEGQALLPRQEPTGLELGERPFLDELTGQGQGIIQGRHGNESVPHRPPFRIGQHSRPFEGREELGSGETR